MGLSTPPDDAGQTRVAIFSDHHFAKDNGVTTTLKAVLQHAGGDAAPRIYTASDVPCADPHYFAARSVGVELPCGQDMGVYWPRLFAFSRQLTADRIDVIHIATPGPVGLAGVTLAKLLGIPVMGSYHTPLGDLVKAVSGRVSLAACADALMRRVHAACSPLLVPSEAAARDLLHRGYRTDRLQIWPRGVDAQRFSPDRRSDFMRRMWDVGPQRPAILYVGRLAREKGLDLMPAIQRQLIDWRVSHRLVFVGDGPMRDELRSRCPDALFLGAQAHGDVGIAMASSDLFLFPSATDTLGTAVLEAQASGLPVVVSDRGGACEQMFDGLTGRIAPAGDASGFADLLATIIRHRDVREPMARNARAFALTRTWPEALWPLTQAWRAAARRAVPVGRSASEHNAIRPRSV